MSGGTPLREDEKQAITVWSAAGIPQRAIAEILGRSLNAVQVFIRGNGIPRLSQAESNRRSTQRKKAMGA